ncbi:hypothetical protein YSY43_46330 [Paenibacillus sp. YSY-4.3]
MVVIPRVLLPISEPAAKGFLFFAYPLSILGNNERTYPWIMSNFIQVCFDKDFKNSPVPFTFYSYDFSVSPWLKHEKIFRNTLQDISADIVTLIKACINNGKYVHLYLDERYVVNRRAYQKFSFIHENFIYGYDDDISAFHILGFDQNGQYVSSVLTYKQLLSAYQGVGDIIAANEFHQELHPASIDIFNTIQIFELNLAVEYSFNKQLVLSTLKEYLNGDNTSNWFAMLREPWDRVYGMECYSYIQKYYELLLKEEAGYDIRYLHNLWEHKQLMTKRVQYMKEQGHTELGEGEVEEFRNLEQELFGLRNAMIKYSLTNQKTLIEHIYFKLPEMAQLEQSLIEKWIKHSE